MHTAFYFKTAIAVVSMEGLGQNKSIAIITMTTFEIKPLYKMAMCCNKRLFYITGLSGTNNMANNNFV
jgi:hypothetical protein